MDDSHDNMSDRPKRAGRNKAPNTKIEDKDKVLDELIILRYEKMYSVLNMVNYLKDEYGIKSTRAYELVRQSREKMGHVYSRTNEKVMEDAIAKMEDMQQKSYDEGNIKVALEIQKELNRLLELGKQNVEIDMDKITIVINSEQK